MINFQLGLSTALFGSLMWLYALANSAYAKVKKGK